MHLQITHTCGQAHPRCGRTRWPQLLIWWSGFPCAPNTPPGFLRLVAPPPLSKNRIYISLGYWSPPYQCSHLSIEQSASYLGVLVPHTTSHSWYGMLTEVSLSVGIGRFVFQCRYLVENSVLLSISMGIDHSRIWDYDDTNPYTDDRI